MNSNIKIYKDIKKLSDKLDTIKELMQNPSRRYSGICGFDGFVDTFIQMEDPAK